MNYINRYKTRALLYIIASLFSLLLVTPSAFAENGYTWTNDTVGSSLSGLEYSAITSSSTGQYVSALNYNGDVYTSNNYGAPGSWTDDTSNTSIAGAGRYSLTSSSSGQYISISANSDIYTNNNYGAPGSWRDDTPSGSVHNLDWQAITSSSTGQYISATVYDGNVYTSNNYGASGSWTDDTNGSAPAMGTLYGITASSSGQYVTVLNYGGDIYTNNNYGASGSWTDDTPSGTLHNSTGLYGRITSSSSGQYITVAGGGGDIYTNNNYGASGSWTDDTPSSPVRSLSWTAITSSSSGQYITGVTDKSGIYTSNNYGAPGSWTIDTDSNTPGSLDIEGVATSSDGQFLTIYSQNSSGVGDIFSTGLSGTASTLSNPVNSEPVTLTTPTNTYITCSSPVTEASQTKQDSGYIYPLGLVDLCFTTQNASDQVTLDFVTSLTPSQVVARDYNTNTQTYMDVPGAVVTETTYNGQPALQLTYTISSSSAINSSTTPGLIVDPVGLAVTPTTSTDLSVSSTKVTAPSTGYGESAQEPDLYVIIGLVSIFITGFGIRLGRKQN